MPQPLPPRRPDGGPAFAPLVFLLPTDGKPIDPQDARHYEDCLEDIRRMNGGGISQRLYLAARFVPVMAQILAREGRLEEEKAVRSALNFADTLIRMNERDMNPAAFFVQEPDLRDKIAEALISLPGGPTNDACVNAARVVEVLRREKIVNPI